MNLRFLEYFQVLARYQHYAKAAEELGIAQSSLSHAMNCLEQELDAVLFEKQGRNIVLTYQGEQYLQYVQTALQILKTGQDQLRRTSSGIISIGFVSSVRTFILDVIAEFQKIPEYSDCQFQLYEGITENLIQDLHRGELQFVVASRAVDDAGLVSEVLLDQELVILDSLQDPILKQDRITMSELAGVPMVLHTRSSGMRRVTDALFEVYGCRPLVAGEASEDAVIAQMVAMSIGAALVTDSREIRRFAGISINKLEIPENHRQIYLTRKKGQVLPAAAAAFLRMLEQSHEKAEYGLRFIEK